MKIVREHLNEIRQNIEGSGLTAIGVGGNALIAKIKKWFTDFNNSYPKTVSYTIDDNLHVVLNRQTDYLFLRSKLPEFIKIKFRPTSSMFNIAVKFKDNAILNELLEDYNNLNIIPPEKYKKFINDLENLNYLCVSTAVQFRHNALVFIDLTKQKIIYVRFFDNYVTIRRGEVLGYPWHRVCQKMVRRIIGKQNDEYTSIIDYLAYYREKN
jgi:hypothetical protein